MSVSQNTPSNKIPKFKRGSMNRPSSGLIDDFYMGFKFDIENESINPSYKIRLYALFKQIEKEFDLLYQENQTLQEKIEILNEKLERDVFDSKDSVDYDTNLSKILTKKLSTTSQKSKTAHKLKAQTSKIVSSFKAPQFNCAVLKEYLGHKDGIWEVSVARLGIPAIGTASADHTACIWSIESSKCLLQYQGHSGSVNSIRFHPAKDLVLTASGDGTSHIWQAALNWDIPKGHSSEEELDGDEVDEKSDVNRISTLRTPFLELTGHSGAVLSAEWLAGADQIITASWDRLAILHDVETGSIVTTLSGHDQELNHCAAHPTQKLAVTSSRDTTFRLWDFRETVHSVSVFQGHAEITLDTIKLGVFARGIATNTPLAFRTSQILLAEPLKKKKRLDPAIIKAREERKKRKLEKQIRRLEKNARQFKPIDECEVPMQLRDNREKRKRNFELSETIAEQRILLGKKWSLWKYQQHLDDIQMLDRLMFSQQKALDELKKESNELYEAAIQLDETLLPFNSEGPKETPPIQEYDTPDGDYKDVTKVW